MKTSSTLLRLGLANFLCAGLAMSAAYAAPVPRTFVASTGSDANACTRTAPCRTFGAALAAVSSGGDVVALDAAGYGGFIVNKSATVMTTSNVYAGLVPMTDPLANHDGIIINAGSTDVVTLKGLSVTGDGQGTGIDFQQGAELHISNCTVQSFYTQVNFGPQAILFMSDTTLRGGQEGLNVGNGNNGYHKFLQGPAATSINHCRFEDSANGVRNEDFAQTDIRDSVFTNNAYGILADTYNYLADVNVENCMVNGSSFTGIANGGLGGPSTIRVSNSTITHNNKGVQGTVLSRGNNTLVSNTTDGTLTTGVFIAK